MEFGQLYEYKVKAFYNLVGITVVHQVIIMVIVFYVFLKHGIHKVQGIDRLQTFVAHAFLGLCNVCFRCIQQHTLFERIGPRHLHLYNKLTLPVILAAHIHNTIFLGFGSVGNLLGRPILYAHHLFIVSEWQHGVEQTDNEVFMFSEDFLEGQVGLGIQIL